VQKEKRLARRGRILIADDEESVLLSTADLLRIEGYECACASDAKTAVDMLRRKKFDLLIALLILKGLQLNTGLTNKFVQVFPKDVTEKPEQISWPIQYLSSVQFSSVLLLSRV